VKVLSVVGARPQFIKEKPLSVELRKKCDEVLVHTGQHYDMEMSRIFFDELKIPEPDYNLGIGSDTSARQIARMIAALGKVLRKEKPDAVVVFGDTNSTTAGALAASAAGIQLAHIEAGMRSFNLEMPEEINRVITDNVSQLLFAPTKTAVKNLEREKLSGKIFLVGDVMFDAFRQNIGIAEKKSKVLEDKCLERKKFFYLTVHRASNTDIKRNLAGILGAVTAIEGTVFFPVHPRTGKALKEHGLMEKLKKSENIVLSKPVGYLDSLVLTKNAVKVLTDSGGLQKEAFFAGTPCVSLREEKEWVETFHGNWNILAGTSKEKIVRAVRARTSGKKGAFFGNGHAAKRIVKIITGLDSY